MTYFERTISTSISKFLDENVNEVTQLVCNYNLHKQPELTLVLTIDGIISNTYSWSGSIGKLLEKSFKQRKLSNDEHSRLAYALREMEEIITHHLEKGEIHVKPYNENMYIEMSIYVGHFECVFCIILNKDKKEGPLAEAENKLEKCIKYKEKSDAMISSLEARLTELEDRVSDYENELKIEHRILYYMKNYDWDLESLSQEISQFFDIPLEKALESINYVRNRFPNIKKCVRP